MGIAAPVVAQCYPYDLTNDVVTPNSTSDPGGDYDMDNIRDPSLMLTAHTGDKDDASGFKITFGTAFDCYGGEIVNCQLASGELSGFVLYSDAAWVTAVANTTKVVSVPSGIWTAQTQIVDHQPTRPNWILGVDVLSTGPTPAATPVPASVSTQSAIVNFQTAAAGRTYWETGFVAWAINARPLGFPADSDGSGKLDVDTIRLRSGGTGYRWTMTWDRLTMADVHYMRSLYGATEGGQWPFFFWPDPDQKTVTGTITSARHGPGTRGGLARMLSWKGSEQQLVGSTYYGRNCTLVAESWEEEAVK